MEDYNLSDLADLLKMAADTINQRLQDEIGTLDYPSVQLLTNQAQDLLIKAKELYEQEAIAIADDGKDSLDKLKEAADEINNAIKTIGDVQKVINITTQLVAVAGSALTLNLHGIVSGVEGIVGGVKE